MTQYSFVIFIKGSNIQNDLSFLSVLLKVCKKLSINLPNKTLITITLFFGVGSTN
ncbi:hypothetical protein GCM10023311_06010 [Flaviramulus aquimarinus]|uniref:Uncharacterized protein n=1 Tax=Flaviramulus aquimarinus TaxID=1170456 RepID=A0ABP9ESG6_9FLAO